MTRKDYRLIAGVFNRRLKVLDTEDARADFWALVHSLADALENDNRNFERERFLAAIQEA